MTTTQQIISNPACKCGHLKSSHLDLVEKETLIERGGGKCMICDECKRYTWTEHPTKDG